MAIRTCKEATETTQGGTRTAQTLRRCEFKKNKGRIATGWESGWGSDKANRADGEEVDLNDEHERGAMASCATKSRGTTMR